MNNRLAMVKPWYTIYKIYHSDFILSYFFIKLSLSFSTFGINLYGYNESVNNIIKIDEHRSWFKWLEW